MERIKHLAPVWIARTLIGFVVFVNLDAAFSFMISPAQYAPGFELSGAPGNAILQGMGLLFLMWNIPYLFALVQPVMYIRSLIEAAIMQFIGVVGESILLTLIQGEHTLLRSSVLRFILFDAGGFILLAAALVLAIIVRKRIPRVS